MRRLRFVATAALRLSCVPVFSVKMEVCNNLGKPARLARPVKAIV
jgi:hypothetical protein